MHGCSNDFILTHESDHQAIDQLIAAVPELCHRHRGIGADGLILVCRSENHDFGMRIFNADGSEAQMCGNGIRCFHRFVLDKKLTDKNTLSIETLAGTITTTNHEGLIRVAMGPPVLSPEKIPVTTTDSHDTMVNVPLHIKDRTFFVTAVSMGNPHAVIFTDSLDDRLIYEYAEEIKKDVLFPQSVNVEFVKIISPQEAQLRVNERGVGETLACGTGTCAAVVAAILQKKTAHEVLVHLRGGDLTIEWDGNPSHQVYLTGPAERVFEGKSIGTTGV